MSGGSGAEVAACVLLAAGELRLRFQHTRSAIPDAGIECAQAGRARSKGENVDDLPAPVKACKETRKIP